MAASRPWHLKFMLFAGLVISAVLGSLYLVTSTRGILWSQEIGEPTFIDPNTDTVIKEPLESAAHTIIIASTIPDNNYPIGVHMVTPTIAHSPTIHSPTFVHEFVRAPTHSNPTDPFNVTREVFHGPWTADVPATVVAGHGFDMSFQCLSRGLRKCPPPYMVLFHGPTR